MIQNFGLKDHLEELSIDGSFILKSIIENKYSWLRIGVQWLNYLSTLIALYFSENREIF
jgi:hypothetical protein